MNRRVAILTHSLPPYRVDLFNTLKRVTRYEFRVFVDTVVESIRCWDVGDIDFPYQVCRGLDLRWRSRQDGFVERKDVHFPVSLYRDLAGFDPGLVISHEMGARTMIASLYCRDRIPLAVLSQVSAHSERNVGAVKRGVRRWIGQRASGWCTVMSEAEEYARALARPGARFVSAPNAVDNTLYERHRVMPAERARLRAGLGVSGRMLLYVGQFIERKGLVELVDALVDPRLAGGGEWTLVLVGHGPLERSLREHAERVAAGRVRFVPFTQGEALADLYQASDVVVLPTLIDVWGLVVNEAMASARPVLCSRWAGCARDMIEHGRNGWVFDPLDRDDTVRVLGSVLAPATDLAAMGTRARTTADRFTLSEFALGIDRVCRELLPC